MFQGSIIRVRFLGDLGGIIVTDLGIQGGYQHQGIIEVFLDAFAVRLDTFGTVIVEADAGITDQASRHQEVKDHDGFEDIQFEVPGHTANVDRYIIAHYLGHGHSQGFGLGRIDFSRHNGRPGFIGRNDDLTDAAARSAGKHPDIVADLHQGAGYCFESPVGLHDRIVPGQRFKFIFCSDKGQTGKLCDLGRYLLGVTLRGIQSGTNGRTAKGQFGQVGQGVFNGPDAVVQLTYIAAEFLTQRKRSGIHEVGTTDLDHVH